MYGVFAVSIAVCETRMTRRSTRVSTRMSLHRAMFNKLSPEIRSHPDVTTCMNESDHPSLTSKCQSCKQMLQLFKQIVTHWSLTHLPRAQIVKLLRLFWNRILIQSIEINKIQNLKKQTDEDLQDWNPLKQLKETISFCKTKDQSQPPQRSEGPTAQGMFHVGSVKIYFISDLVSLLHK